MYPHLQAMNRAHRIGQSKRLIVYRLVVRASVEERILQLAKRKLLLDHLLAGTKNSAASSSGSGKERQNAGVKNLQEILRWGADELFQEDKEAKVEGQPGKEAGTEGDAEDEEGRKMDGQGDERSISEADKRSLEPASDASREDGTEDKLEDTDGGERTADTEGEKKEDVSKEGEKVEEQRRSKELDAARVEGDSGAGTAAETATAAEDEARAPNQQPKGWDSLGNVYGDTCHEGGRRRILWGDDAIRRLLNREADPSQADEEETGDQLLGSVKVRQNQDEIIMLLMWVKGTTGVLNSTW